MKLFGLLLLVTSLPLAGCAAAVSPSDGSGESEAAISTPAEAPAEKASRDEAAELQRDARDTAAHRVQTAEVRQCASCPRPPPTPWHPPTIPTPTTTPGTSSTSDDPHDP